ncbi:hypothetical protein JTE90_003074 [Oedothorax gibbosus]|uniref:Fe2OG dioxygenase domain-containing protein n=1 Tax=Oedothorax gibbosus TaxID=931172 RepID=A0AAV6TPJ1_9ARAC|nr:hypothetical protein JTE90_003074 [Oedothorax gibbosus]
MSLPADLDIEIISNFYSLVHCEQLFRELQDYKFQDLNLCFNGKSYTPRRKVLGFGDSGLSYAFSGTSVSALPWTPTLLDIKKDVENKTGQEYNYVFLNFYPDGFSRIGAHRDDESCLDPQSVIPTLSFGATRTMQFTRKGFPPHQTPLKNGSLLLMRPPTNHFFSHEITADPSVQLPRISLTFRKIAISSRKRTLEDCFSSQDSKRSSTSRHISSQDHIPDNDWLTKLYIDERSPPPKKSVCLKEWNLGYGFIVSVCPKCPKSFTRTDALTKHVATHNKPTKHSQLSNPTPAPVPKRQKPAKVSDVFFSKIFHPSDKAFGGKVAEQRWAEMMTHSLDSVNAAHSQPRQSSIESELANIMQKQAEKSNKILETLTEHVKSLSQIKNHQVTPAESARPRTYGNPIDTLLEPVPSADPEAISNLIAEFEAEIERVNLSLERVGGALGPVPQQDIGRIRGEYFEEIILRIRSASVGERRRLVSDVITPRDPSEIGSILAWLRTSVSSFHGFIFLFCVHDGDHSHVLMTAHFPTEPAGAGGANNLESLLPFDEDWERNPFLSGTLAKPPGSICSHITCFRKGYKEQKFSLEESGPHLRFRMQLYDTTDLDSPTNWWKHKSLEMDVGYEENSPL